MLPSSRPMCGAVLALLVFAAACDNADPADDPDTAGTVVGAQSLVEEIRHLELQWADAIRTRDTTALDRLVAADFELTGSDTTQPPVPRDVWMGNTLERLVVDSIRISSADVALRGDTADATLHFVWAGTFNAAVTFHDSTMLTDRWVRGPRGWQVHRRTMVD